MHWGEKMTTRKSSTSLAAGVAAILLSGLVYPANADGLDPSKVKWSALSYKAKKLTFSMHSNVAVEVVSAAQAASVLRESLQGSALEPEGSNVVVVTLGVEGAGTRSTTSLWIDPKEGFAFQRVQISYGKKKNRNKALRFAADGVQMFFGRAKEGESADRPEDWTGYVDRFDDYPGWAGADLQVTEPTALFYLLAAAKLDKPGDKVQFPVWSSDNLILMELTVAGIEQLKVDYMMGGRRIKGTVAALKILVDAQHLDPDSTEDHLDIMGMKGDVTVHLDPKTRAPLQVSGKVPIAGNTKVKLQSVTLE
jgi:hypothetical protein